MKLVKSTFFITLILMTIQCDNANNQDELDNSSILEITTMNTSYSQGENIEVEINNTSQDTLPMFFHCYGSGFTPIDGYEKLDNNNWVVGYPFIVCTTNIPATIWGNSFPGNLTTNYKTPWDQSGTFRLRSKIIYNSDTLIFYSNEYTVE